MTDEGREAVATVEEAVATPPAAEGETKETEVDPVEQEAREKGWLPKEEYKGRPDKWVSAKEYVARAPLYSELKESRREIQKLQKTVDGMVRGFQVQLNGAINEKLAQLKAQKREAIEAGDPEKVERVEKAIAQQEKAKADIPTAPEIAPEILDWVKDNPWYNNNESARRLAIIENEAYLKKHPSDIPGSLDHAKKAVQKAYPEIFDNEKSVPGNADGSDGDKRPKAPAVEGGGAPRSTVKTLSVRNLTREQRLAHDAYVNAGVMSSAQYLKSMSEVTE